MSTLGCEQDMQQKNLKSQINMGNQWPQDDDVIVLS